MSQPVPPSTISIKRKRNEAPVDALRIEHGNEIKRVKSSQNIFGYRRVTKPTDAKEHASAPPTPTSNAPKRYLLDAVPRIGGKRVFVEEREQQAARKEETQVGGQVQAVSYEPTPASQQRPRKRPGAASALPPTLNPATQRQPPVTAPSETDVRKLEALSQEVEKVDNLSIPLPSHPLSKHKPKAPAQRYADRHPTQANDDHADGDAMDIDSEYVYDHYIREPIHPNAPEPTGPIGLLVITASDADWWDNEEISDREFDTDDEDENAEDYYANDYPEDEMSDDDEFGRDLYQKKYRHGSDDEEFVADGDADGEDALGSGEDEDDAHFRMTVPKGQRVGYWGMAGE
ncbi:hypothetical protein BDW02DRAFT_378301 [Decorospora gaudefroyi]|uniref:Transcription factor Iwr1 domain-containing protein n=1 Tax=Decorospora gaudefroyi TaxID=184978 RepID=A0A6A5KB56_9PLEO|nr:hypothetical protein BDW02DRAFT_378301 [Decorospora gaudefroyi]